MKTTMLLQVGTVAAALLPCSGVAASPSPSNHHKLLQTSSVQGRGLPDAPNGYTPSHVSCPSLRPTIRNSSSLSDEETKWLETRTKKAQSSLKEFFGHVEIESFDAVSYLEKHSSNSSYLPKIAIAVSGGGYRAALVGGGVIKAFDSRTEGTEEKGQLGGLLQSSTYFSALSGGSWLLGSIYMNNFTSVSTLREKLWDFTNVILMGPADMSTTEFWTEIATQIEGKKAAGFPTTDVDPWGRMQGYNFFNASHGGANYTWSSIGKTQAFKDGEYPMPLVQITSQYFNKTSDTPAQSLPIYEVNPWEWGTWDDSIYGFAPLEYLGTRFVNGIVPENETCVRGYDNAGFITGSSSDIWAADNHDLSWTIRQGMKGLTASQKEGYESIIETLDGILTLNTSDHAGAGAYEPSPFYKYNSDTNPFAQDTRLTTEDGGQSGQNIPLGPLSQKKRNVDVIFAVDVGADSALNKWPNGNALIRTYQHTLGGYANDTSFPPVPDVNTFYNLGLNTHPTFFGCNASNFTEPTPLIVWLPNYPITFMANISYTASNVTYPNMDGLINNGFNLATQANGTLDSQWSTCVGCAVLSRSLDRTGTSAPEICNQCFERYCWNGTLDTTEVTHYAPSVELSASSTSSSTASTSTSMGASLVPVVWHVSAMLAISVFLTL